MLRKIVYFSFAVIVMLSVLPGCRGPAASPPVTSPPATSPGDKLKVVATTTIVGDVVRQIGGEAIDLTVLLPVGSDPHTFSPSPRDVAAVSEADVVFVNGAGLEEFLTALLESAGGDAEIIDLSEGLTLLEFEGDHHDDDHEGDHHDDDHEGDHHDDDHEGDHHDDDHEGDHHDDDHEGDHHDDDHEGDHHHDDHEGDHHDDDHEGDHHHDDHEGDHHHDDHEGDHHHHHHHDMDPHTWTSPRNVMHWVTVIEQALSRLDAANAQTYQANAAAYQTELTALDGWIIEQIAQIPVERRVLVTDHLVFGYFAVHYGLEQLGAVVPGYSTLAQPSARELATLEDAIGAYDVPAIFVGSTVNPALAQRVAEDTGIQLVFVYTGSLTAVDGDAPTYLAYMRYNVTAIVEALK